MSKFTNYYHDEVYGKTPAGEIVTTNIIDYYKGGTNRISEIRVSQVEYKFENGEHFFVTHASISGNCNGYGGLGFKKIKSNEFANREESKEQCWKKIRNFLKKHENMSVEIVEA